MRQAMKMKGQRSLVRAAESAGAGGASGRTVRARAAQASVGNHSVLRGLGDLASATTSRPTEAAEREARRLSSTTEGTGTTGSRPRTATPVGTDGRLLAPHRAFYERALGGDLSAVRVHADGAAADAAGSLGARAFAVGRDLYFGRGEFTPGTPQGRRLLAHELAHVARGHGWGNGVIHRNGSRTENNPMLLGQAVDLQQLLMLYATDQERFWIGPAFMEKVPVYTQDWIRGEGQEAIRDEIRRQLEDLRATGDIEQLSRLARSIERMRGNESRKVWLRNAVNYRFRHADLLTDGERNDLKIDINRRLANAYTDFNTALSDNLDAIHAAAEARAALFGLVVEMAFGFLAPGIGRGVAALANRLPASASRISHRVAIAALDEQRTERIFNAATKVGTEAVKRNANALFGETEVDQFGTALRVRFRKAFDAVGSTSHLNSLADLELLVLYAAFAPEVSDVDHYRPVLERLLDRYQRQVVAIGDYSAAVTNAFTESMITRHTKLYYVVDGNRSVLALLDDVTRSSGMNISGYLSFVTIISPDMRRMAVAKARQAQGRIETVQASEVRGWP